jgi:large subunit ribosomal protein L6
MWAVNNSSSFGNTMSRLGKQPIEIPSGVEATLANGILTLKGPKGTLTHTTNPLVEIVVADNAITLTPTKKTIAANAMWGTHAALVRSMLEGIQKGYTKVLEIEGVGYRAEAQGQKVTLSVGFSHPVVIAVPAGITVTSEKNVMTISGIDKHAVGQFAANVRKVKKPEPYKGKGIRYKGEYIIRKQGKKAV